MKEGIHVTSENFSEKVSVNINSSTLSSIDLLVDNGYYSNRSDFINQALRESLQRHRTTLDRIIDGHTTEENGDPWFIGVSTMTRRDIEKASEAGRRFTVRGYGVLVIDGECPVELLYRVVQDIRVKGKVFCADAIKKHYGIK